MKNGNFKWLVTAIALAIPGLGHVMLKKYYRAALFGGSVLLLFIVGALVEGQMFYLLRDSSKVGFLEFMASVGNLGLGVVGLIAHFIGVAPGNLNAVSYEYGTTFISVAALLNILVAMNAFDIAAGRKK